MIIMDVKGGSWVGDMYKKFEDMCAEVEEVIYEDTFKYVESQVRNVGETVKKFYSDVTQDFLPPSLLDSPKAEDTLSPAGHHGDIKISKKPKVDDEDGSEKLVKDVGVASAREDSLNYGSSCSPIFNVIKPCNPISIYSAGDKSAKENCWDRSVYSAGDRNAKENSWSQGTELVLSDRAPSEAKHLNSFKNSNECRSDLLSIDETMTKSLGGVPFDELCNRGDESTSIHEDSCSKEVPAMNHNENDGLGICRVMIECYKGDDAVKVNKIRVLSGGPLSTVLNGHLSTDIGLSTMEADLIMSKSSIENTIELDKEHSTFETETSSCFLSTEYRECEADEGFLVERLNEDRLGESCVLVEKSDTFSKSGLQNVHKSYKKKIQDVLSPRRWSKSKRNKEDLADWYDEQCGVSTTNMMQAELQKSPMSESFESDWELL